MAISFLILIIGGTFLLLLPFSSNHQVTFIDALFTSTSACCVTGLAVVDTGTQWTLAGQIIILLLIQFGGLGIMTFSTLGAYIIAGKMNVRNRQLIEDSLGGMHIPKLGKLLSGIVLGTLTFEMIGALLLTLRFIKQYPFFTALYHGIFHSISAFCNAGFALYPNSLERYQNDITVNLVIMALIVTGGIGYWVLFDVIHLIKNHRRKLGYHSIIVISTSAALILIGMVAILLLEWNNTLSHLALPYKVLNAAFQSITPRTAGFNTIKIENLNNGSIMIIIILMLIGASPGSCGGGIKTSTFAVIMAMIVSRINDQRQVRLYKRGVPEQVISKSIAILFFALFLLTAVIILMLMTEHPPGIPAPGRSTFVEVVFEAFSALGTVGLSMGLTPFLSLTGKIAIIFLMYLGRIGPLTIALAIATKKSLHIRYAEEQVWVG
ncbi:MAG TPA: TrkH family potassium uptake protein [bacterium]|nr:TrkH family potassium uptake protein [bacterium]HPN42681.1 TrkH family potassium uptake protein [bacterium]